MSLIKLSKYITQVAELRRVGHNSYGDTVVTSTSTVNCLIYVPRQEQFPTAPTVILTEQNFALFSPSTAVAVGDHLANVKDRSGNTVVDGPLRIKKLTGYHHWRYGTKAQSAELEATEI